MDLLLSAFAMTWCNQLFTWNEVVQASAALEKKTLHALQNYIYQKHICILRVFERLEIFLLFVGFSCKITKLMLRNKRDKIITIIIIYYIIVSRCNLMKELPKRESFGGTLFECIYPSSTVIWYFASMSMNKQINFILLFSEKHQV